MKKKFSPPAVGGTSLFVIFAVLCLTVFALLALSTVNANTRIADAAAESILGYYKADTQAEEILAKLRQGKDVEGVIWKENLAYYNCEISERQSLEVCVKIDGEKYSVLSWKVIPVGEWENDESLPVWTGEEE